MSRYIYFTEEQLEQARQTDIVELLRRNGEKVDRSGTVWDWKNGYEKVTFRGNLWYHQYEDQGSDAIDFVRRFYNMNFPEAVEYLLNGYGGTLAIAPPVEKIRKPFELPKPSESMRRIYGYLIKARGLDKSVIDAFAEKKMIYESEQYHNVVFVGYDKGGVPRHAHKRGSTQASTYRGNMDSCLPEYSFHWHGGSSQLYVFEAPIDMLSFISMNKDGWRQHSYAAACGVSSMVIYQMMKDNPNIKKVWLCHDNDEGGEKAVGRISAELEQKGIAYDRLTPILKDWNEDLTHPEEVEEILCKQSTAIQLC